MTNKRKIQTAFGAAVRRERLKRGISQEKLGFAADLDRTYIGGVERGERNLGLFNILRISEALKIKPTRIFASVDRFLNKARQEEADHG